MKMNKPRKRPITIAKLSGLNTLSIETLTEQAEQWARTHAKEFGELVKDLTREKRFLLFTYSGYNCSEVADYLRDLWDSQTWPEEV
jgi:hypothetical protein